jgi:DNA-binding winged helix-turn-helix (wHTH) protein
MTKQDDLAYCFAGFELQPGERRLVQAGEPVALTPKAFEILQYLVERAGHVVAKDELLAAIWPGRFVLESNLTKHIWTLRKALGESEEGGRYIETVSKVGYRFVSPVTRTIPHAVAIDGSATPPTSSSAPPRGSLLSRLGGFPVTTAVAVAFAAAALSVWWQWHGSEPVFPWSSGPPGSAVAIFEFDNLSRNPKDAWIGPAFAEMLATEVAQGGQLHLLPGELIRSVRSGAPDPDAGGFAPQSLSDLRRQLAVDFVVTGSYLASEKIGHPPVRLDLAPHSRARVRSTICPRS